MIIDAIELPQGLKKLGREDVKLVCGEIRKRIIETCAKTGGHLGSSLGVVELTVALHRVFDSPHDKFIFDVSHQAYPHKILTGRALSFGSLRTYGGISGFCRRDESFHDAFGAGHAGTALSASVGIAEGMGKKGDKHKVIAVMGDGSMTNGMVFEAMNQMSSFKKNVILVLNDNAMSIAPNVGAISDFINERMTSPCVTRLKEDIKCVLSKIPNFGDDIVGLLGRVKHSVKHLILPTIMFEGFGFRYVGPIDGHNLESLEVTLQNIRMLNEPVLLHVVTEKGKGYAPAEREKERFHGLGPFDIETGKVNKKKGALPTYTDVFSKTMVSLAERDKRIIAITAAMPSGTGLKVFKERFPDRFYDVGIAEEHAVTFAGGLAAEGFKPVCAIYSTFLQRSFDQMLHDICLQNLDVTFALDRGGLVGEDGPTHHGVFDLSYLRMMPNMVVMAPRDEREFQRMLATAIAHKGPASVRYPRGAGIGAALCEGEVPLLKMGQAEIVFHTGEKAAVFEAGKNRELFGAALEGSEALQFLDRVSQPFDVAIWAVGSMVKASVEAAKRLAKARSLRVIVVNGRFIKPIDKALLEGVTSRSRSLITVEENVLAGGFGSAILEVLEERGVCDLPVRRFGIGDAFVAHGAPALLQRDCMLDVDGIEKQAVAFLDGLRRTAQQLGYA